MISELALSQNYQVESHESVDSTNALAIQYAQDGHLGRLWINANKQTSGRGRRGNVWESPSGNLHATLLLVDEVSIEKAAVLGFVAGVSLAETISELAFAQGQKSVSVALKWPNDILLNDAKASGILLETSRLSDGKIALVIGIGLNVAHHPNNLSYATSSLHGLGILINAEEIFNKLSEKWAVNFTLWQQPYGEKAIHDKWLANASNLGGPISVNQNENIYSGVFETLDDQFRCILKEKTGKRIAISAGEVHFGLVASGIGRI